MNKLIRLYFPELTIGNYTYSNCHNKLSTTDLNNIKALLDVQDETYSLELKNMSSLLNARTLTPDLTIDIGNRLQCDEDGIYEENRYSPHKVSQESDYITLL